MIFDSIIAQCYTDVMDDRRKTIAALTIIVGVIVLVVVIVGVVVSSRKVVSPVPDEGAIRVIFISPTSAPGVMTPSSDRPNDATQSTPASR